jgi:hypothetical protein
VAIQVETHISPHIVEDLIISFNFLIIIEIIEDETKGNTSVLIIFWAQLTSVLAIILKQEV